MYMHINYIKRTRRYTFLRLYGDSGIRASVRDTIHARYMHACLLAWLFKFLIIVIVIIITVIKAFTQRPAL